MEFFHSKNSIQRYFVHEVIFFASLAVVLLSLPFVFTHPVFMQIYRAVIFILVANWVAQGNFKKLPAAFRGNPVLLSFLFFYLLHAVGVLYSQNLSNGIFQLDKKIAFIIFPFVFATTTPLTPRAFRTLLKLFLLTVLVSSVICFAYAIHRNNYWEGLRNPVWFYFSYYDLTRIINIQPNYLAIYTSFSIFLLVFFFTEQTKKDRLKKILILSIIAYLTVFLLLLSGRAAILATFLIGFGGTLVFFHKKRKLIKGIVFSGLIAVIFAVLILQIPIIKERVLQTLGIEHENVWINQMGDGKGGVPSVRLLKWKCAMNVVKDNWMVGTGTGDVQDDLQQQYKLINFDIAYNAGFNTHNQFLQTAVGLGIPGVVLLLACFVNPTREAIRQRDFIYLSLVILFVICSVTESTLERHFGITFYVFFTAFYTYQSGNWSLQPRSHPQ